MKVEPRNLVFNVNNGLNSNHVYSVIQDKHGNIWIGTEKGLSMYDGKKFNSYSRKDGLCDDFILRIAESPNNCIWFSGYNNTVCFYNQNHFQSIDIPQNILKNSNFKFPVTDFKFLGEQTVLFIGSSGIIQFNTKTKEFSEIKLELKASAVINSKISYAFLNSTCPNDLCSEKLLYNDVEFDLERNTSHTFQYTKEGDIEVLLISNRLFVFRNKTLFKQIDAEAELWGVEILDQHIIYSNKNGEVYVMDAKGESKIIFENKYVSRFFKDQIAGVWMATLGNGLIYIPNINLYSFSTISELNTVTGIFEDSNSISLIDNVENKQIKYTFDTTSNFKNFTYSILFNNSVDIEKSSFGNYSYEYPLLVKTSLSNFKANAFEHSKNSTYLCNGIAIYKLENSKIELFFMNTEIGRISCFYNNDLNNDFLIGTNLGLFTLQDGGLTEHNLNRNMDVQISDIEILNSDTFLASRSMGLIKLTNGSFEILDEEGVNSLSLYNDTLWVASDNGVQIIYGANESIHEKILVNTIFLNSRKVKFIVANQHKIYLITEFGINMTTKENLFEMSNIIFTIDSLSLKMNEPNIPSFFFKANFLNAGEEANYRYRLIGLENANWLNTKENFIAYSQLKPGNYSFEVSVQLLNGEFSPPKYIDFNIKPLFWQTLWFKAFFVLFSLGVIVLIIKLYIQNKENKRKIESEINDLKQQSLNAQMNPHFVFNSLNSIQNFILQNDKSSANKYLIKFSRLIRLIFENSKKLNISLKEELEASAIYLELEALRTQDKFSFHFDIDPNVDLAQTEIPSSLIQPLLENAVWHGIMNKEGKGEINIRIYFKNDQLFIEITDDGVGRDASNANNLILNKRHSSSGLFLTEKRLDLFNNSFKNDYYYEIIDLRDEKNQSIGTKIIFSIPSFRKK